mmetsp:Transcript_13854/g.20227  ORF Transcript_13854/g.20227 Transcript_13854/m.20227 type:complete len:853 (+) Transcript_13854:118-2676(+)
MMFRVKLFLLLPAIIGCLRSGSAHKSILQFGLPPSNSRRLQQQPNARHGLLRQRDGRILQANECSGTVNSFYDQANLNEGQCMTGWTGGKWQYYPYDFEGIENYVKHYECPASGRRVIVSNGIPNHSTFLGSPNLPCEKYWHVSLPLHGTYDQNFVTEASPSSIIGMALNGVPVYGALELTGGSAVEPGTDGVMDAKFWYGHATETNAEHYHAPNIGNGAPASETLLAYALDGFPIYGPLEDDSVLDECNGIFDGGGNYRYHVRSVDQVDEDLDYCNGMSPVVNWKYVVGCFHGDSSNAEISTWSLSSPIDIPDDCTEVIPDSKPRGNTNKNRPNIIVMQPDDLPFFDEWTPPTNNPIDAANMVFPNNYLMPNIERLRTQGLQMKQAYAASPACGTSRFSTLTGKNPSRSARSREINFEKTVSKVTIPTTKLMDVAGFTNDCTEENMAAAFAANGYRTGVTGKWHLYPFDSAESTYSEIVEEVQGCGFDFAGGMYAENLNDDLTRGGKFNHNMEWVTAEAIKFINGEYDGIEEGGEQDPFLLYFNPTVPHSSGSVLEALTMDKYNCTVTADVIDGGLLPEEPVIKGMTMEHGNCKSYRNSVIDRAGGPDGLKSNGDLGAIWVDDAVGALLHALIDRDMLDNTIFLFQLDHGIEGKQTLYENGNRIVQFVHYPDEYGTTGHTFNGLVSTIDIAPTMFDFAGITNHYDLDGSSWRDAIGKPKIESKWKTKRCLLFEYEHDRAVRCGCGKYMKLRDNDGSNSTTLWRGQEFGYNANQELTLYFNLCEDGTNNYISFPEELNPEVNNVFYSTAAPIRNKYRDVLTCWREATSPLNGNAPDFGTDCSALFNGLAEQW